MFISFLPMPKIRLMMLIFVVLLLSGCGSSASTQPLQKPLVPAGRITEFPTGGPVGSIATGLDGNLWFTETLTNKIGRITPEGFVTTFAILTPYCDPEGITAGPNADLWFTETSSSKIGRITPNGSITEFAIPTPSHSPSGITAGPNGDIWFIDLGNNELAGEDQIVRMTPAGVFTEFPVPTPQSGPDAPTDGITTGPDGNLWFIEANANKIARITPTGIFTEFSIPTPNSYASAVTIGSDGNLWFTETMGNKIGRITPGGTIAEFTIPSSPSSPIGITTGPDGNLWFTESDMGMSGDSYGLGRIGRITPKGTITEFPMPVTDNHPLEIIAGSDHNLWFTEANAYKIGRITSGKGVL